MDEYLQRKNLQTLKDDLILSGISLEKSTVPAIESPVIAIRHSNINHLNFADESIYNGTPNGNQAVGYLLKETLYISKLVLHLLCYFI